jgi:hypothetical protein
VPTISQLTTAAPSGHDSFFFCVFCTMFHMVQTALGLCAFGAGVQITQGSERGPGLDLCVDVKRLRLQVITAQVALGFCEQCDVDTHGCSLWGSRPRPSAA